MHMFGSFDNKKYVLSGFWHKWSPQTFHCPLIGPFELVKIFAGLGTAEWRTLLTSELLS